MRTSEPVKVGDEEGFLLVDAETGRSAPRIHGVMRDAGLTRALVVDAAGEARQRRVHEAGGTDAVLDLAAVDF